MRHHMHLKEEQGIIGYISNNENSLTSTNTDNKSCSTMTNIPSSSIINDASTISTDTSPL